MENWIWLFPATCVPHLFEEAFAGERFFSWPQRLVGRRILTLTFAIMNGGFFALMIFAILTLSAGRAPWLPPGLGAFTTINGLAHLAGPVATRSYSPGLVTGILRWTPLGLAALASSFATLNAGAWFLGVGAGLAVSLIVVGLALAASTGGRP